MGGQAQQNNTNATRAERKAGGKKVTPAAAAAQAPKPSAAESAGPTAKPAGSRKPMPDFGEYFKDEPAAKATATGSRMESKPRAAAEPIGSRVGAKASAAPKMGKGKAGLIGGALLGTGAAAGAGATAWKNKNEQQKVAHQNILSDMEKFASRIR